MRRKGLEDLNVYRHQQEQDDKVREDLNMQRLGCMRGTGPRATGAGARFFSVPCEGQALALRVPGRVFFVAREPVSCDRFLILCILCILLQTR